MIVKQVITVSEQDLTVLTTRLLDLMAADGFVPDAVVGIANGGALVVDSLPAEHYVSRFTCMQQRPSTAIKERAGVGQRILKAMPYRLTNLFRVIEDRVGQRSSPTVPAPSPSLDASLDFVIRTIAEKGIRRIAVLDDAVDSGATLACVSGALRERLPDEVAVRTGVITRTRSRPQTILEPDYFVFENTLCRFHWAADYKGAS